MKIASNGSWLNETNEGHCFDESLCKAIVQFCYDNKLSDILDLGCGDGKYVDYFNSKTLELWAMGCDGNPNTQELATHNGVGYCYPAELHKPLSFSRKPVDLIMSLEVGEHIPAEYEDVFLDNVVKYAKDWIILSWAVPGQGGDGHVNCQDNDWVCTQMTKRGFGSMDTRFLRDQATLSWFKDSLMIFKRIN